VTSPRYSYLLAMLMLYSKRVGLLSAFHQIEDAIKKSKADPSTNRGIVDQLQRLLLEAQRGPSPKESAPSKISDLPALDTSQPTESVDDKLALDDAENPLQLLARASDLRLGHPNTPSLAPSFQTHLGIESQNQSDIHRFFLPMKASADQDPHLDPVSLGLVTVEEAKFLMTL
jgi:hypothetical protein